MTRETKIGLLVGLAFIIVIGILLSDHLTSSTEPPQAALANAGSNVRSGVTVPGQPGPQPAPVTPPTNIAPHQPVATQNELAPRPDPVTIVRVGPGNSQPQNSGRPTHITAQRQNNSAAQVDIAPAQASNTPAPETPAVESQDPPTITHVSENNSIADVARANGEEIVSLGGRSNRNDNTDAAAPRNGSTNAYKAESGDSLSKMASKFLGGNTKSNRDAIIAVNPSLKDDPNKIIVGRTYQIPSAATSSNTTAAANEKPVAPSQPIATNAPRTATAHDGGEYWYTVKEGDSLWRIATEQCGKAGAVAAIKELNKDLLKGENHDVVHIGMKLRMPTKPLASAN